MLNAWSNVGKNEVEVLRKVTVNEYAIEKNVTPKTVYEWIRNDKVKHGKEVRNNQEVIVIYLPPVQEDVTPHVLPLLNPPEQNNSLQFMEMFEYVKQVNERFIATQDKLVTYAEMVGTVKLLEDSERKTKQEYFQIIQENATLKAQLDISNQQNKELQAKLQQQEKTKQAKVSWWSKL